MSDIKGHPGFIAFWGNSSTGKAGSASTPEAPVTPAATVAPVTPVTPAPVTAPATEVKK